MPPGKAAKKSKMKKEERSRTRSVANVNKPATIEEPKSKKCMSGNTDENKDKEDKIAKKRSRSQSKERHVTNNAEKTILQD